MDPRFTRPGTSLSSRTAGFTLIELMIAVAILAILTGVAVPSYQNYVVRAKVAECMHLTAVPQLAISEFVMVSGRLPDSGSEAGYVSQSTRYCESLEISDGGVITATTQETGASTDPILRWTPETGENGVGQRAISWRCELVEGSFGHVPVNCRQEAED